ncbi:MAG: hypothetical protein JWP89_3014 [Schlesneria sp.]|nr:hypothetical protein [Schlesneria sp.]
MSCDRCGKDVDPGELQPMSPALKMTGAFALLPLLLRYGVLRRELTRSYCEPCLRRMNFSVIYLTCFAAFVLTLLGTVWGLQQLGILKPGV